MQAATRAYEARWATRCAVVSPSGTSVTITIWIAKARKASQIECSSSSPRRDSLPRASGTVRTIRTNARARVIGAGAH
jgi:hypothetical protein